jgi:hypothetical protein
MEQPGCEPTLHDEPPELRARRECRIEVQRVAIARELGERAHVIRRERQATRGALADGD